MNYPDQHHPVFFLQAALAALGVDAAFNARDSRTEGCWGLIINGKPMVWLIDNRWEHERQQEDPAVQRLLERGALVCHAQKPDAARIGGYWLPLAVTPGYEPKRVNKTHDVGFVGYVRDMGRANALIELGARYRLNHRDQVFGDEAVNVYCAAHAGLNVPTQYGNPLAYDSANMRCFEILATGTPLVTPDEDYLAALGIESGKTAVLYRSMGDLIYAVRSLLDSPQQAKAIGEAGTALAKERHTYAHRAKQVMEWLS